MRKNTCNGCVECCVGFPLAPNPNFWPEGKRAQERCRFLKCDGCSIHDQPRPCVCTGFECVYIIRQLPPAYWPKTCKVVISTCPMKVFFQTDGFCHGLDMTEICLLLTETAPRALVALDANKLRYYLSKKNMPMPRHCCVAAYDFDCHDPTGTMKIRTFLDDAIYVGWKDSPDYAEEVKAWWVKP
jgi:hypothetical protein